MPVYCMMDFRDYTTLRDVKRLLDYDSDLAKLNIKDGVEVNPYWAQREMENAAKKLEIVINNLYTKPYSEVKGCRSDQQ